MVAEAYPPECLFDTELAAFPTVYRDLRTWLNDHGANLGVHPSRRVITLLADRLYDDETDKESAKDLAKLLLLPRARRGGVAAVARADAAGAAAHGANDHAGHSPHSVGGMAHSIGMRFKDEKSKFSGRPDQALHEYLAEYQQVGRDYGLDSEQRLRYLHNLFGGEAKRFFDDHVDGRYATLGEAIQRMGEDYNSPVRQTAVSNELTALRMV